jgi:hypothetical protein
VYFDNRELAERHTPRFNRFLAKVRAAALAVGGTWQLAEPEVLFGRYLDWLNDDGIRL